LWEVRGGQSRAQIPRRGPGRCPAVGRFEVRRDWKCVASQRSFAMGAAWGQWAARFEILVLKYMFQTDTSRDALTTNSTEILVPYPRCTIGVRSRRPHSHSRRNEVLSGGSMDTAYQPWIGQAVVLQVALGEVKVPLRGRLLKD